MRASLEFRLLALYCLLFLLVMLPYYAWAYRVTVNLLHFGAFWLILGFVIGLIPTRLIQKRPVAALTALAVGAVVFLLATQLNAWRYSLTERLVRLSACGAPAQASVATGPILGGIEEIRIEGGAPTGAFENSSHCLLVACAEEFYYCEDATIRIGQCHGSCAASPLLA